MRSALRGFFVSQLAVFCPVLFLGCDAGPAGGAADASPGSTAHGTATGASQPALAVRHVDAAGAAALLAREKEIIVLDVRTPREFGQGHVTGATNIDFNHSGFAGELAKLDRGRTYLVYCAAGGRSTKSLSDFAKLGFTSVVHLDGGFNDWSKAGQPVQK